MGARGPKPKFEGVACPNRTCQMYGRLGQGNVVGNGSYHTGSGNVRKFLCRMCGKTFSERSNTAFFDLRSDERDMMRALKDNSISQSAYGRLGLEERASNTKVLRGNFVNIQRPQYTTVYSNLITRVQADEQ